MNKGIGVALIGYGFAGETFHAPLIAATEGLRLAVVSSSKPDKVHERFPHLKVAHSPEDAITDTEVALVVIASPNASHAPLAAAALNAGKHVVCDKPFTLTTDEARTLKYLAEDKKLLLSVFHNRRYDGDFLTLERLIAEDKLGSINYFESHIDRFRPQVRARWREQAGPGAGVWYDLGPHLVDQSLQLFGPPANVQASILAQRPDAVIDDYAHVVLGYATGLQVVLHASMLTSGGGHRFLVHGSKASWAKHGSDVQEAQLLAGVRPGDAGWGDDPDRGTLFTGTTAGRDGKAAERRVSNEPGSYQSYYAAIRDAILGRRANPVTPDEAVMVMAVLETARASATSGQRVAFQP